MRGAVELLHQACNHGDLSSCTAVGLMRAYGLGGPKDVRAGLSLLRRACAGGVGRACEEARALVPQSSPSDRRGLR